MLEWLKLNSYFVLGKKVKMMIFEKQVFIRMAHMYVPFIYISICFEN